LLFWSRRSALQVGLRQLEQWHKPSVRWAWSTNAAASVLGSVCALVCAIYLGLIQTLLVGGLLYVAALAVILRVAEPTRGGIEFSTFAESAGLH
jgi:hypothetical protein